MRRRLVHRLSLVLGSTLGLTGCPFALEYGAPVPEYGAPQADYQLDGTVTDGGTGDPIQGIQVDFQGAAATSGPDGSWSLDTTAWPCDPGCEVTATDVDGEDHGAYTTATVPFTPTQVEPGDGSWDEGTYSATVDVELTPAE